MIKKHAILCFTTATLLFSFCAYASPAELFRDKSDTIVGNPDGKVSVAEFFDYRCSHCVNMDEVT